MKPEKSLGEIAATAAGWTWDAMPASQRAEWQRGAEAVLIIFTTWRVNPPLNQ